MPGLKVNTKGREVVYLGDSAVNTPKIYRKSKNRAFFTEFGPPRPIANRQSICKMDSPTFLENAVKTAKRVSIGLLSMREVTRWRW